MKPLPEDHSILRQANALFMGKYTDTYAPSERAGAWQLREQAKDYNAFSIKHLFRAMLSPTQPLQPPQTLDDEMVLIKQIVMRVLDATEKGTLSETEADAVIRVAAGNFVRRRFHRMLEGFLNIGEPGCFFSDYEVKTDGRLISSRYK